MSALAPDALEAPGAARRLSPDRQAAWVGILQAHAELTRALETQLSARHGLSLSAYEVLSRLANAEDAHLRMTDLAEQAGLSLSRVSRVIDSLQARGHVVRRACPGDSRVVHATITDEGRTLAAAAQVTFLAVVDDRFLSRLSEEDVLHLGALLGRLVTEPLGSSCPDRAAAG